MLAGVHVTELRLDEFSIELVDVEGGVSLVDHTHNSAHLLVVDTGAFCEQGRVYGEGGVRLSLSGDRHFVRFLQRSRVIIIHGGVRSLDQSGVRWSGTVPEVTPAIVRLVKSIGAVSCDRTFDQVNERAHDLLDAIRRMHDRGPAYEAPLWLSEIHGLISADPTRERTVGGFARAAGISREHLARSFRRRYGTSISAFLRSRRVIEAYYRLVRTDASLVEIAQACCFSDQSHMTRSLAGEIGITPAAARRRRGAPVQVPHEVRLIQHVGLA